MNPAGASAAPSEAGAGGLSSARAAAASPWDGDQAPENGGLCEVPQGKVWDELKLTKLLSKNGLFGGLLG